MATSFVSPPPRTSPEVSDPQALREQELYPRQRTEAPRSRYTVDGGGALEAQLHRSCELVSHAVLQRLPPGSIEGLLLGGGYGRGEGGVLQTRDGEQPYNDLEFYVFVRGNRHAFEFRHRDAFERLSHELSPAVGLEVEFKIMSLDELRRTPISMFFYDMIAGHKWLIGGDDLFHGCAHHRAAHLLPLAEATRLLMNRCTGLLFAREHLSVEPFEDENADFIRRNISKAKLAFGDAILAAFGRYHWSCRTRHERLEKLTVALPWHNGLVEHHGRGVDFKLHPFKSEETKEELASEFNDVVAFASDLWLWLESKRLGHSFISARHYATNTMPKLPASKRTRNVLHNLKLFRRPTLGDALRHPRERVLESLAVLLWEPVALMDSGLRALLERNLRAKIPDRATAIRRYAAVWSRVS
jgi:hypothetical protein